MKTTNKRSVIILYKNQNGKCCYCGCELYMEAIEDRLIHPKSKGGKDHLANLALTCQWCNHSKKDKTKKEFLEYIKPYLDGKVGKHDLAEFKKYRTLHKKFKGLAQ